MNRREFSQAVVLGAGSLGTLVSEADAQTKAADLPWAATAVPASGASPPACVADYQNLAQVVLPQPTYDYVAHGSTEQVTLRENVDAFQRIRILPPLLHGVDEVDTSTTLLGQKISMPILLAPTAAQTLYHPDGILAAAKAAGAANTILGVSSSCGHAVEEIAAVSTGPKWFQFYVPKDRAVGKRLIQRVEQAGFQAIIVTVDLGERKDADLRNGFTLPPDLLRTHLQGYGFDIPSTMTNAQLYEFSANAWDQAFTWKIFDWLRSITKLPLLIKGVLRAEDARQAVALGLEGIVVSNHGGRRLDGVPATIDRLPLIVDAVADRSAVLLDSGVRRGTDVFKALAFGADAVLIGRPHVWALASGGEPAVRHVLQLLQAEFTSAMHACGCATVGQISRDFLLSSPGGMGTKTG